MPITIKTPEEQEKMRVAGRLAADVLDMIEAHVQPGVSTEELDQLCYDYITQVQKAVPANVGYHGFPKTICSSVNQVVCHGIPNDKKLKNGDIINIDVTVIRDGFHGDTSRMYSVGKAPVLAERLVRVTRAAMWAGLDIVRPGTRLGDIGHAIQTMAEAEGFSVVREYCGHGIGRIYHEDPQVLHYGEAGTGTLLARRHDLHHRAHDQRRQAACAAAEGRLDGGHQGSLAVRAVGTHGAGNRQWPRGIDARRRGSRRQCC